ncbi:hypothetical protein O181_083034 [Austropuccinia psidii MF-1]|uniref:Uncharacterized protein n=1 Tax=Austropuccinia psidii MF-1 TaxID=1389203 RepID=A0A9Q3FQU2_9BASI|nr:hypothetical protein [Austropuccinia psidii MF-1]
MLEKGWNTRLPGDILRKELIESHPTYSRFKIMLDKAKYHEKQISNLNFNNMKGPKRLKDSYIGAFVIVALHGTNEVQVGLSGELKNKNPTYPVSLIEPYQPTDNKLFPLRNPTPLTVPPVEQSEDKKIKKVIKERGHRGKN